jgi:hypothetical protein
MIRNHLYFKVKESVDEENYPLLDICFKEWISGYCDTKVNIISRNVRDVNRYYFLTYYKVIFDHPEDLLAIKLAGLPPQFDKYLEIIT